MSIICKDQGLVISIERHISKAGIIVLFPAFQATIEATMALTRDNKYSALPEPPAKTLLFLSKPSGTSVRSALRVVGI